MADLFNPETVVRVTQHRPHQDVQDTSREAHEASKARAANIDARCVRALRQHGPMTADECADRIGERPGSVRPSFTAPRLQGKLEKTGGRRRTESGRPANVMRLTPEDTWHDAEAQMTGPEQIAALKERVSYLELLLTKEGIAFGRPGRPL